MGSTLPSVTLGVVLGVAMLACTDDHATNARVATSPAPIKEAALTRVAVPALRHQGLSGITVDDGGHFWAVSEEKRELVRFDASWDPASRRAFPLVGVTGDLELESVEWLGDGRVALGTETDDDRDVDAVLVARIETDRAVVERMIELPWAALYGASAPGNRGIEGLCASGGTFIAAAEWYVTTPAGRFAPLVRGNVHDARIDGFDALSLRLTSASGKISALDCARRADGGLTVHAVERHYGTTRILRFVVPAGKADGPIEPVVLHDLAALDGALPNIEGMAIADGRIVLVSDHDEDEDDGTTEMLTFVAPRND